MNSVKKKKHRDKLFSNLAYDFVRVTGVLPVYIWMRPKIYRPYKTKNPKGAVLISANHQSMTDPISVLITFPIRRINSLATDNLFKQKFLGVFFRWMHCIEVDRSNFNMSSFRTVVERLEQEKAVLIFPEGEINKSEEMLTFKSGLVLMAHRAKAKILPLYIVPRKKWYQRQRIILGSYVDVYKEVGAMPSMEDLAKVSDEIRQQEIALCEYFNTLPCAKKYRD